MTLPLVNFAIGSNVARTGWLLIAPVSPERASYGPLLFLLGIVGTVLLTFALVRRFYHGRVRRGDAWGCGFPARNARLQDTAAGFGQPIKQIFAPFFRIRRHLPIPFDAQPLYPVTTENRMRHWLYQPVASLNERVAAWFGVPQHGRIYLYLLYSFVTRFAAADCALIMDEFTEAFLTQLAQTLLVVLLAP